MDPNAASLGWILLSHHSLSAMVLEQCQQMTGLIACGCLSCLNPNGVETQKLSNSRVAT